MTEDEMVGWHHWLNGHEFGQALGVGDGQGSLECCSPWGHKESNMTEWLNWTDWSWSSNTLVTWFEEPAHWKRPWCWERLRTGEQVGNRGWDSYIASLTQWTWLSKLQEIVEDRWAWSPTIHRVAKSQQLSNWTDFDDNKDEPRSRWPTCAQWKGPWVWVDQGTGNLEYRSPSCTIAQGDKKKSDHEAEIMQSDLIKKYSSSMTVKTFS